MLASFFYKKPATTQADQKNGTANKQLTEDDEPPSLPLKKNKAFITFITATTLMHFGYYIPFVHLVGTNLLYRWLITVPERELIESGGGGVPIG